MKADFFFTRLAVEQFIHVSHKIHKVHRLHLHHHLSLIYFTQVQNLIDESQNTFRITAHHTVRPLPYFIEVRINKVLKRSYNQCHRRTNLMIEVHEEL